MNSNTYTDPYQEHRRREARKLLQVARSARRSGQTHNPRTARKRVADLYRPTYSRADMADYLEERGLEPAQKGPSIVCRLSPEAVALLEGRRQAGEGKREGYSRIIAELLAEIDQRDRYIAGLEAAEGAAS